MEGKKIYRLKQRTKNIFPEIHTVSKLPCRQSIVIYFKIEWELFYYRSPVLIKPEEIKRIADEYPKCLESGENNLYDFEVKPKKWRKIDVNQQLHINWECFANYVWEESQK